eukprot:TRINITY_DN575_c0_g1_i3.p1 TRINITY_DN575_c0_g1~~TRINITY_DN575_c0_g1_i3.p1  ORF type:complete len:390 (+),score=71.07 TRINITY_DN575_c0_g1_i3:100-1269(+)
MLMNNLIQGSDTQYLQENLNFLDNIIKKFDNNAAQKVKDIEKTTNHDVKAVEYYVKSQFSLNKELNKFKEFVHFCCTSEDVNNLAYSLMLNDAKQLVLLPVMNQLKDKLVNFAFDKRNIPMLSRTHGQIASPTTLGKEFANFGYRLSNSEKFISKHVFSGKMNGAVGNYNSHLITYPNSDWLTLSSKFITQLGLKFCPYTTQCDSHDNIAEFYSHVSNLNTILIGFARDIWHYISIGYLIQKQVATETGSSTMPHKVNPIDFENAEGNLGLSQALCMHMIQKLPIKRWQRDLSDSTVMRNHGVVFGYNIVALKSLVKGLNKIEVDEKKVKEELNSHWEVLAEPIQMVMRKWGIENPYEIMKKVTRGKNCLLYTSPSPRDRQKSRMPSSA